MRLNCPACGAIFDLDDPENKDLEFGADCPVCERDILDEL